MTALPFVYRYLRAVEEGGWIARWTHPERGFILAFLRFVDGDGVAYPGIERLAKILGVKERHVERTRASLVKAGWLAVAESRQGLPSKFRLVIPPVPCAATPPAQEAGGTPGAAESTPPVPQATHPRPGRGNTPGLVGRPNSVEQPKNNHEQAGVAGGGGGAFSKQVNGGNGKDSEVVAFLEEKGVNLHAKIRQAIKGMNLTQVGVLWKSAVNTTQPGPKRIASFAQAIMDRADVGGGQDQIQPAPRKPMRCPPGDRSGIPLAVPLSDVLREIT
jgi:hypothetical protein